VWRELGRRAGATTQATLHGALSQKPARGYYYHITTAASHNVTAWSEMQSGPFHGRKEYPGDRMWSIVQQPLGPPAQLFDRFPLVTRLIALREDCVAR
jgi:hypothetical protein